MKGMWLRLIILLLVGAAMVAIAVLSNHREEQRLLEYPQVHNLKRVGEALDRYAAAGHDRYPARLEDLVSAGYLDASSLAHWNHGGPYLTFPAAGLPIAGDPTRVIAYDGTVMNDPTAGYAHVLFANGHVESISKEELQRRLIQR